MQNYSEEQFINIGSGSEITIRDLSELVRNVIGFTGEIVWDKSQTGRHAAKIDGQLAAVRAGLEAKGGSGNRHPAGL